jgi:hypothetical protein
MNEFFCVFNYNINYIMIFYKNKLIVYKLYTSQDVSLEDTLSTRSAQVLFAHENLSTTNLFTEFLSAEPTMLNDILDKIVPHRLSG